MATTSRPKLVYGGVVKEGDRDTRCPDKPSSRARKREGRGSLHAGFSTLLYSDRRPDQYGNHLDQKATC